MKNIRFYALGFCCVLLSHALTAQEALTYKKPPQSIVDLVDAPRTPAVRFDSKGSHVLLLGTADYPDMEEVAQPIIGLAGLRINPRSNASAVGSTFTSIGIKDVKSGKELPISGLPDSLKISQLSWSPDENAIAFSNKVTNGVELWLVNLKNGNASKLTDRFLNETFGSAFSWNPDGTGILALLVPANRDGKPVYDETPKGPIVQENDGKPAPSRTYQNLLKDPYDEQLMDYFLTSELAFITLNGNVEALAENAIYRSFSYSPSGDYLLLQKVVRPYSYLVPINSFPYETSIVDRAGKAVKHLFTAPLAENLPIGFDAVAAGPRYYSWRSDKPHTLTWVEALDGGDPAKKVEKRDALYTLEAPFTGQPNKLIESELRHAGVDWANDRYAVTYERWRKDRRQKMLLIEPSTGKLIKEIANRSSEDTYSDPGDFVLTKNEHNQRVILMDGSKQPIAFTIGEGASKIGDRPFLMKWNLLTGKQDTLFKSEAPYYEYPLFFKDDGFLIGSRESVEEAPSIVKVDLKTKKLQPLTSTQNPYPGLDGITKKQLSYPRKDGINLTATLYLPKDFKDGDDPLPTLIWAYPREFKSQQAAGQVKGSPYRFTRLSWGSPVYWVTRGYAVLDNADMPVVGEGEHEPNDTFVEQIRANAEAIIDYAVGQGFSDRNRIAVGGHSYGAFMTANLLAHTDLFAAGIARSGAYNRTFTPFGFQAEERTYWQAPDLYYQMSPFSFADKIKAPLLMTHGMDDENSGTFPIQSERLYNAIKGHGGTVRLVLLPKEFHSYRAKESVKHTLWEIDSWLEKHVKNRPIKPSETE